MVATVVASMVAAAAVVAVGVALVATVAILTHSHLALGLGSLLQRS